VRTPKTPEVAYRRQLNSLVNNLREATGGIIVPLLRQFEVEYVNDSYIKDAYAKSLSQAFQNLTQNYLGIGEAARMMAESFVDGTNTVNKKRFYKAIENAVGINLSTVIQKEDLEDILVATTRENVALIKSIPEEFFKKIETAVFTGTTQGADAKSLIDQIKHIGKVTENRAKLIARDQTTKLNSSLNQQRQQNLGVEEYIWRTAGDDRVRQSHRDNNGKTFKWSKPSKVTGHPGNDIQCRCVAQPIINV
jgi:SPP1 gp7 family putative phage head morphogenesis protein